MWATVQCMRDDILKRVSELDVKTKDEAHGRARFNTSHIFTSYQNNTVVKSLKNKEGYTARGIAFLLELNILTPIECVQIFDFTIETRTHAAIDYIEDLKRFYINRLTKEELEAYRMINEQRRLYNLAIANEVEAVSGRLVKNTELSSDFSGGIYEDV